MVWISSILFALVVLFFYLSAKYWQDLKASDCFPHVRISSRIIRTVNSFSFLVIQRLTIDSRLCLLPFASMQLKRHPPDIYILLPIYRINKDEISCIKTDGRKSSCTGIKLIRYGWRMKDGLRINQISNETKKIHSRIFHICDKKSNGIIEKSGN